MSYGTIVVCGGGCYGGYYVRQLARARLAGAIRFKRLVVVDHNPDCAVAQLISAIGMVDDTEIARHGWRLHSRDRGATVGLAESDIVAYRALPVAFEAETWESFFAS
jgi:hypothetical protein